MIVIQIASPSRCSAAPFSRVQGAWPGKGCFLLLVGVFPLCVQQEVWAGWKVWSIVGNQRQTSVWVGCADGECGVEKELDSSARLKPPMKLVFCKERRERER